jgi:hypothetical protein
MRKVRRPQRQVWVLGSHNGCVEENGLDFEGPMS